MNTEEIIQRISTLGGKYDPESKLSLWEQLLVCESIVEATPVKQVNNNGMISVNGSVNDSCKRIVNIELTQGEQKVITELKACSYKTSPRDIGRLLNEFFIETPSKEGHWLYIAQRWTPRTIVRVINKLTKVNISGKVSIQNPAAYFTYLIKFRKKRRNI